MQSPLEKVLFRHTETLAPHLINIYLVAKGARDACLIDDIDNTDEIIRLGDYCTKQGLQMYPQHISHNTKECRWLVARESIVREYVRRIKKEPADTVLNQLLGFYPSEHHQWHNVKVDRLFVDIYVTVGNHRSLQIAFVLEKGKTDMADLDAFLQFRAQTIKGVLPHESSVDLKIRDVPSICRRAAALIYRDQAYLVSHLNDFHNDVWNWIEPEELHEPHIALIDQALNGAKPEVWSQLEQIWINICAVV